VRPSHIIYHAEITRPGRIVVLRLRSHLVEVLPRIKTDDGAVIPSMAASEGWSNITWNRCLNLVARGC
jgi:hypothetical protein